MTPPVKLPLFESYALNPEIDLETITDHTHDHLEPEQDSHLQIWAIDGLVHRDHDQPAVIHQTFPDHARPLCFSQVWYQYGLLHRDADQPAILYLDGIQEWYQSGWRHRDNDQPAVMSVDGTKIWINHGQIH